ncbi:MAG: FHA domain-containing protein [Candidatus Aminicenantes bacterium]|nr:FHA domain-containing protein [Candidatus Aminicenantes bacterium]
MTKKNLIYVFTAAVFLLGIFSMPGYCDDDCREVMARDVNANLVHQCVKIWGTVREIFPDRDNPKAGTFILKDRLGDSVTIRTENLPKFGEQLTVKGNVYEAAGQFYILQKQGFEVSWVIIAAGGTLLAFLILLIILIVARPKTKAAAQPAVQPSAPAPPAPAPPAQAVAPQPRPAAPARPDLEPTVDMPMHTADYFGMIEVIDGDDIGKKFEMGKDVMIIGRDPSLDIVLTPRSISRKQAQINVRSDGMLEIINLGKAMFVDGKQKSSHILKDQDVVQFAGTFLKFNLPK